MNYYLYYIFLSNIGNRLLTIIKNITVGYISTFNPITYISKVDKIFYIDIITFVTY